MPKKLLHEMWFDDQTRLWLTCDHDSCLLELAVQRDTESEVIEVEILRQATDPWGLAIGPPLLIHSEHIRCRPGPTPGWLQGQAWLPSRFATPHHRSCYFRIRQVKQKVN